MDPYAPSGRETQEYLDAYTDAILWVNCYQETPDGIESVDGTELDEPPTVDTGDALAFLEDNEDMLAYVSQTFGASWSQHGHDFALTRNGHGAGFWDRGYGVAGELLSDAARVYGDYDVYVN